MDIKIISKEKGPQESGSFKINEGTPKEALLYKTDWACRVEYNNGQDVVQEMAVITVGAKNDGVPPNGKYVEAGNTISSKKRGEYNGFATFYMDGFATKALNGDAWNGGNSGGGGSGGEFAAAPAPAPAAKYRYGELVALAMQCSSGKDTSESINAALFAACVAQGIKASSANVAPSTVPSLGAGNNQNMQRVLDATPPLADDKPLPDDGSLPF